MSEYKPFDKNLYEKNDSLAKELAINYFKFKEFQKAEVNPDRYGPDLQVISKNGLSFYVEVEIKQNWDKYAFPFATLNIPKRKGKFLNNKIVFMVISKNLERAVFVNGSDLEDTYLKEVNNRYVSSGEQFYQIPTELCKFADLPKNDLTDLSSIL